MTTTAKRDLTPARPRLAQFRVPVSWWTVAKRTVNGVLRDDSQALAAQLAYYFLFAALPAVLCLVALASMFPLQHFTDAVTTSLGRVLPPDVIALVRREMTRLGARHDSGVFSVGLVVALWSSSTPIVSAAGAINRSYHIEESRSWWHVRLVAIAIVIGLSALVCSSFVLVMVGPEAARALSSRFGFGPLFVWTWAIVQWPIVFLAVAVAIESVYHFAPDADRDWEWISPGSVAATSLWLIGSLGLRVYAANFGHYEATYGAIGAVMLLVLWFYVTGLAVVVGAEVRASIEHASPSVTP